MLEAPCFDDLREILSNADDLPSLPNVALQVLRLTSSEDASIADLAGVIARDPALAAKLLKLANSSMFRRGDEVTTLDEATMRLGLKTVKLMALSFSLVEALPKSGSGGFDYGAFWRQGVVMTVSSRSLARLVGSKFDDEAYLCGLLSGVGRLVLVDSLRDTYAGVVERCGDGSPDPELEREVMGFDHYQVGATMLEGWELPSLIVEPIAYLGDLAALPDDCHEDVKEIAKILHLARVATSLICGQKRGRALVTLEEEAQRQFGLSHQEVETFALGLENGIVETAALLNLDVERGTPHDALLAEARQQMVNISLDTAMDLQETVSRAKQLEEENRELATRASTDALTGLPNRASFDQRLQEVVEARLAGNGRRALGLLVLDVDHFKAFNDTHGHQVGDEVLRHVGATLADLTRQTDFAGRYGGEEFVMILPNVGADDLELVAERVRVGIESMVVRAGDLDLSVTVSVGGACCERVKNRRAGDALVSLADECLYEAKQAGRNCSVCKKVEAI